MIKQVECRILGMSPLLMHAFPMDEVKGEKNMSKEELAERSAYRTPDKKELFVPAINLQRAFIAGATYSKGKGRASLQKAAAACIDIAPEYLILNVQDYTIDSRPVVVPATKGRIIRHRPRFNDWAVTFTLSYDSELMSEKEARQIVDDTGLRVGLLDFRPEKKGPFGKFKVTFWQML